MMPPRSAAGSSALALMQKETELCKEAVLKWTNEKDEADIAVNEAIEKIIAIDAELKQTITNITRKCTEEVMEVQLVIKNIDPNSEYADVERKKRDQEIQQLMTEYTSSLD